MRSCALHREICKRDIESEDHALNTILDGIEIGKRMPIRDIIEEEKAVQREMLLNDGDMSFISSDDEDFRWIDDYSQGKIQVGLDTGDEKLDEHFRYKKEFVIVNGHSNVGKTTTMLYLIANSAVRHGWKWVLYSSENRTASIKMTLMQFAMDKKVTDMTTCKAQAGVQVGERSLRGHQQQSDIQIQRHHLVHGEGHASAATVDAIFVDPYNSLKLDMGQKGGLVTSITTRQRLSSSRSASLTT